MLSFGKPPEPLPLIGIGTGVFCIRPKILRPFEKSCLATLRAEERLAEGSGFLWVEPRAREDVEIGRTPMFREVPGNGTCLYKLYQRISRSYGIIVAEVRYLWLAVAHHLDNIVAKLYDELPYLILRRNLRWVAIVEIQDELLAEIIGFVGIRIVKHGRTEKLKKNNEASIATAH